MILKNGVKTIRSCPRNGRSNNESYRQIRRRISNIGMKNLKSKVVLNKIGKMSLPFSEVKDSSNTKGKVSLSILRRRVVKLDPLKQIDISNTRRMNGHSRELKCDKYIKMLEDVYKNSNSTFDIRNYVILL